MKRAKRLLINSRFFLGTTGLVVLLVGFLSFSKPARQGSPAVSSSASGWVFEVIEEVEEEFEDEVGFWKGLHLRRRFGVEVLTSLDLRTKSTTDIAADTTDDPWTFCVVYYDETNGDLKYAEESLSDSIWHILTLDSRGDVGKYPAIAIDYLGGRHVSYYDATNGDLKYAYCTSNCGASPANWTIEVADSTVGKNVGLFTEITVDNLLRPHISYIDSTNKSLKYATKVGDWWYPYTVEDEANPQDLIASTSIGLDSLGKPHISYSDRHEKTLRYAYSPDWGPNWNTTEVPDSWDDVGLWNSIAVGVGDTAHISYSASDSLCSFKALKYTRGKPW